MSASQAQAAPLFSDVAPVQVPQPVRLRILFAVMVGIFLAALDNFVVGTALPVIITDLSGNNLYTWAFTAYLLTATISGPIHGKLSDLYGRRPIFLLGIGIFLVGSALAGFSQSMEWLIVARGIQGLGAGALFPIALAIIGDIFAPSERGKYQGLFGAVFGIAIIIGPAVGGLLTDSVGWEWVFFVNLPVGAVVIYLVARYLPSYHLAGDKVRIDYIGAALFTAALVPILVGLTNASTAEWTDVSVGGYILLGFAFLAAFVFVESRVPEPIVPLSTFRIRSFSVSVVAIFLAAFAFFATVVFLPRWFQVVIGSSATESGYQIFPSLQVSSSARSRPVRSWHGQGASSGSSSGRSSRRPWGSGFSATSTLTRRSRSSGRGCSSPASASAPRSRSSRSSCRTACRSHDSVRRPAT